MKGGGASQNSFNSFFSLTRHVLVGGMTVASVCVCVCFYVSCSQASSSGAGGGVGGGWRRTGVCVCVLLLAPRPVVRVCRERHVPRHRERGRVEGGGGTRLQNVRRRSGIRSVERD